LDVLFDGCEQFFAGLAGDDAPAAARERLHAVKGE
jgi:hypothetical protein